MFGFKAAIAAAWPRHCGAVMVLLLLNCAGRVEAQEHEHHHEPPSTDSTARSMAHDSAGRDSARGGERMADIVGMPEMHMPARPFGIPMSRMGSGTSWLPDASPMRAYHLMTGRWTLMVHGDADLYYDWQDTNRGADQVGSTNWAMIMAMRPVGAGMLHLHGMLSAEPFTVGARGYPLLLQTGESYQGLPLHDRQHPHDLFMELSARYEVAIGRTVGLSIFAAPVGEPAIGPVAYMHRPSARNDLFAPLGHHWQDATHITYGVLTAGVFTRTVQLEATWFQGREPDDDRYDFDFGSLDSWGGRVTINPASEWSVAASYGYLHSPEELHPDESQHRLSASVLHTTRVGRRAELASALVYGANRHVVSGQPSRAFEHSLALESDAQLDDGNSFFGRLEWVQKDAEELVIPSAVPERTFSISSLALGYVREVLDYQGASLGLGVRGSLTLLPDDLEPTYGSRTPVGLAVYARLRPSLLQRGDAAD
jgi:hypothetical protein